MSTIKDKCKDCWVESVDENSVCYAGKHRIIYCSLHDAASQMKKALETAFQWSSDRATTKRKWTVRDQDVHENMKRVLSSMKGEKNEKARAEASS